MTPEELKAGVTAGQEQTFVTDHLRQRVGTVERNLDALREQNSQTQAQLSSLRTESHGHTRDLHDIKEALTKHTGSSKTDWQVIGVFLGLAVIIATLAFAPVYRDLVKLEERAISDQELTVQQERDHGEFRSQLKLLEREMQQSKRSDSN